MVFTLLGFHQICKGVGMVSFRALLAEGMKDTNDSKHNLYFNILDISYKIPRQ